MAPRPDEFSLIAELFAPLSAHAPGAFNLTDDAAVFAPATGMETVLTVDALVEGVHFLPGDPAESVARKLLRVNLSDLAAKGASPRGYLLTAAWRADTPIDWIRGFAGGLAADQRDFGLSLWGGDTVSTPGPLTFSLTAIGEVPAGRMLKRAGAAAGEGLYVTGTVGDAALGLAVAQGRLPMARAEDGDALVRRYRLPEPRVSIGPALRGIATAALDVSDGLMADLAHLCAASGTGARVETGRLPLSTAAARALADDAGLIETVLTGGDDYEILFSAPLDKETEIARLAARTGIAITRIGTTGGAGEGIEAVDQTGRALTLKQLGFRHF
ncbi:MAG TPA: thiamine-phosphate kinase [Parvibaculum sp.]